MVKTTTSPPTRSKTDAPLAGVPEATRKQLDKLGLVTNFDLVLHLPLRYEDETRLVRLRDTLPGQVAQIEVEVVDTEVQFRPKRTLVCRTRDGNEELYLRFFNFYGSQIKQLAAGTRLRVMGEVRHGRMRRSPAWDCGFPAQTARMQDSAEGFGQPIKQIFEPFFKIDRHHPSPFDEFPQYSSKIDDRLWYWLYLPIVKLTERLSSLVGVLHHGRISLYLAYSFITLLLLLLLVR